jgi:hypothetical protein
MSEQPLNRLQIAWRAAQDITDGMLVNSGLGMPCSVADYLRPEVDVFIQSENGVIGVGAWRRRTAPIPIWSMRQPAHHDPARRRLRRFVLVVRHDPRRPHRRGDPGRLRSCGQWRSGQLGHAAAEQRDRWSAAAWTLPHAPGRSGSSWST